MQAGDILTAAEADYIESLEAFIFMCALGNTDADVIAALARQLREASTGQ